MALPEKCPLCHAGMERQAVVTPHVFGAKGAQRRAFFHCDSCDVRYQYPGLTPEEESRFYAAEFEGFMASRAGTAGGWHKAENHVAANEPTRLRRMAYLEPHLTGHLSVLEVGCSSGFMLYPLAETGHKCTGVEPSGVFSEFVKQRGLPVHGSLDQLRESGPDSRFDVIYDIPAFERFYWSVAHPWYFSESSLHYLIEGLGCPYEILRDQRYDLSNHMVWARDGRPGGMGRFSEVFGPELDRSYKQALIKSGQCDTLVGIISKD